MNGGSVPIRICPAKLGCLFNWRNEEKFVSLRLGTSRTTRTTTTTTTTTIMTTTTTTTEQMKAIALDYCRHLLTRGELFRPPPPPIRVTVTLQ